MVFYCDGNEMSAERSQKSVLNFILMRAFRRGVVRRGDVLAAFDSTISETRASEMLRVALDKYSGLIERDGYTVKPRLGVCPPSIASEEQLMEAVFSGNDSFAEIGLTDAEFPRQKVEWTNNRPIKLGLFQSIASAIVEGEALDIVYVTLNQQDHGRRRSIFPVGLQKVGDQWRLVAYDLSKRPAAQRVYVLSRILEAARSTAKVPKSLRHCSFNATELVRAPVNAELTEEQRMVIEHELSIHNGLRRMPASEEFEFLRRYGGIGVSPSAVWPIIERDSIDE